MVRAKSYTFLSPAELSFAALKNDEETQFVLIVPAAVNNIKAISRGRYAGALRTSLEEAIW
jgi:hypothetical protein